MLIVGGEFIHANFDSDIVGECMYAKWRWYMILYPMLVSVLLNICLGVESYIHAYMVDVNGFYIRVDDVFVASWVDGVVVVDGFYIRVDDVFVASWVDDIVVVDGTVCM